MMSLFSCVHCSFFIFSFVLSSGLYSGESYVISNFRNLSNRSISWHWVCPCKPYLQLLLSLTGLLPPPPGIIVEWVSVIFLSCCVNCRWFSLLVMLLSTVGMDIINFFLILVLKVDVYSWKLTGEANSSSTTPHWDACSWTLTGEANS